MADDDTNLADPSTYDLVPVDHTPQFADAPVPKAGQTVQQPNVMGDISSMPGKVASAVGDVTGVTDAYKAATGQMTPEEAQMFALGALPMLAGGPEAKAVGEVASDIAPEVARGIRAFHGSPYDFNQFDLSKIGTGESAQAYGHGLYFAEAEPVATHYRDVLASRSETNTPEGVAKFWANMQGGRDEGIAHLESALDQYKKYPQNVTPDTVQQTHDAINYLKSGGDLTPKSGKMYEVNINADPDHFLDWDKPLSEQSPKVQEKLSPLVDKIRGAGQMFDKKLGPNPTGEQIYSSMGFPSTTRAVTGDSAGFADKSNATSVFRDAGIPGIKYLDQGSRGINKHDARLSEIGENISALKAKDPSTLRPEDLAKYDALQDERQRLLSDNQGTRNYVVFNDKIVDIIKKYGLAGLVAGGASHFSTVPVDHQPDFGDQQQGMATGGSVKSTKTQANYRGGTAKKRCGTCDMFVAPSGCTAVRGVISPQALCDFYERAKDLRTLYVMRPLLNAGDVIAWAKSQGFKKTVTSDDMHVTIAFSRDKVAHDALKPERGTLVASGGRRTVKPLGDEGAVVLTFESSELAARWKAFREIGASWDYDAYHPHVTITYDGEGMDLKGIKPYAGPLRFGPEKFSALDEGWKDKITERASGGRVEGVKIDATHDGPWMSCMSIDGSTMYRNKNIPATATIKGKTVDVNDMLLHHEIPERDDLENLMKEFETRHHRKPTKNEAKAIYLKAHNRSGTPNERAYARKIGVDWKAWSAWCRGEESKIEKRPFTNQPKDADVKPIPHQHGELEAVGSREAA